MKEDYNKINKRLIFLIGIFGISGLIIFIKAIWDYHLNQSTDWGNLGQFLSGTSGVLITIAALLGLLLAYLAQRETINNQEEQIKDQKREIKRNREKDDLIYFNTIFFKLFDNFTNVVNTLSLNYDYRDKFDRLVNGHFIGRDCFEKLNEIYRKSHSIAIKLLKEEKNKNSTHPLAHLYDNSDIPKIDIIQKQYDHFIKGNISVAGHYFRNMYHLFKLIYMNRKIIREEEFYYANLVKAQLSENELILLFYNSLSEIAHYSSNKPNFKFYIERYSILEHLVEPLPEDEKVLYSITAFKKPYDILKETIDNKNKESNEYELISFAIDEKPAYTVWGIDLTGIDFIRYSAMINYKDYEYKLSFTNKEDIVNQIDSYLNDIDKMNPLRKAPTISEIFEDFKDT